jgi:hypothetical protein
MSGPVREGDRIRLTDGRKATVVMFTEKREWNGDRSELVQYAIIVPDGADHRQIIPSSRIDWKASPCES